MFSSFLLVVLDRVEREDASHGQVILLHVSKEGRKPRRARSEAAEGTFLVEQTARGGSANHACHDGPSLALLVSPPEYARSFRHEGG
jgi:hypothetical protein